MDNIFSTIDRWSAQEKPMALATVVGTWGSSPRGIGAKMVVNSDGEMVGSVSGGCVESAVVKAGIELIQTGFTQLLHFGVTDDTAWDLGLACGGEIDVFVQPLTIAIFTSLKSAWDNGIPAVRAFAIKGPDDLVGLEIFITEGGGFTPTKINPYVVDLEILARNALEKGANDRKWIRSQRGDEIEVFIDLITPTGSMVIVGGVHIAVPLVNFANELGYYSVIIDPRKKFANHERFPTSNRIVQAWPKIAFAELKLSSTTAVAVLSHDPKIDDQALAQVINSDAFYIGALGSEKTQSERRNRLLEAGFEAENIDRIRGPIGLDLGSRSPAEIALAIMAEIIQVRNKA